MNLLALFYVIPLLAILAVGVLLVWGRTPAPAEAAASRRRVPGLAARIQPAFGRISGCILVLAAGAGACLAIVWPFGYWARKSNASDHKVYNWVLVHQSHWLHSAMKVLTQMSNNRQTQVVAAFFMVALTIVWFFHRRGLVVLAPAVLIIAAYEIEHQLQHTLKFLAARHITAPEGMGSFPSGGVARIISVYGLIIYLLLRRFGKTRSKIAIAAWTVLAAASYTEAYSRLYLGKHWISDVVGGVVLGVVLLYFFIVAAQVLDRPDRNDQVADFVAISGTSASVGASESARSTDASPAAADSVQKLN